MFICLDQFFGRGRETLVFIFTAHGDSRDAGSFTHLQEIVNGDKKKRKQSPLLTDRGKGLKRMT